DAQAWMMEGLRRLDLEESETSNQNDQLLKLRVKINQTMEKMKSKLGEIVHNPNHHFIYDNYNALCRGEQIEDAFILQEVDRSPLVCFHLDVSKRGPDSAHLRLTHARVEEVHKNPNIVIVHQFLTDKECEILKRIAGKFVGCSQMMFKRG